MRSRAVVSLLAVLVCTAVPSIAAPIAQLRTSATAIDFSPLVDAERFVLTVSSPDGKVSRREFAAGEAISFSFAESRNAAADGNYNWELTAAPRLRPGDRTRLEAARQGGAAAVAEAQRQAGIPAGGFVQSGSFRVADGAIVDPAAAEPKGVRNMNESLRNVVAVDQVIPDDLIVQGSTCTGLDCINNENFGFDTLRLKENNLRIHFEDTSTSAGFPANDWTLIANDSASGGSSKFSIEDRTGSKVPFTITAGAATNSIFADSTGRIGLRTATPVLDLHINTSNTPAIRLEQNNSGGFTAQTWDIGANEANFFVRDVTGGSKLSFRIRPGAPTSSLDISADGDVGVGTASPDVKLHVRGSNAATKMTVEEDSGTVANREIFEMRNNGGVTFAFTNKSTVQRWGVGMNAQNFLIDNQGNPGIEFTLGPTGNLTITGIYSPSDRNLKKDIVPVEGDALLDKLAAMPIATWSYKTDDVRHVGPMAQDFAAAFGLGIDDTTISPNDMAGISMAAAQALFQKLSAKEQEIADLKARLAALEAAVAGLSAQQ